MKSVLITGSNGYIGGWLSRELKAKGYRVIGCGRKDRSNSFVDSYYKWDIATTEPPDGLDEEKIDVVIHAASSKSLDIDDIDLSLTNIVGTQRIIGFCKKKGVESIVLVSSGPVTGTPKGGIIFSEDSPLRPETMYHATKAMQEIMVMQLEKEGIKAFALRPSSPVAPIMTEYTIFSIFVEKAVMGLPLVVNGNGTRRQNYIDIRDFANAVDLIIRNGKVSSVYYVTNDYTVSNIELAEKCKEIACSVSTIVYSGKPDPADDQVWAYDSSKIKNEIGFIPSISIEKTIKDMISEMKEKKHG